MGRLRDHRPRLDTSVCPDQAACDRLYHPILCYGDHCECCGDLVAAAEPGTETPAPTWEPVKDPADRRKVVYWRLCAPEPKSLGAVSPKDGEWRALLYTGVSPGFRVLGHLPTRRRAQRLVEAVAAGKPVWHIERYDAGWGGWRKVRAAFDTEDPATFVRQSEAQAALEQLSARETSKLRLASGRKD